MYIQSTTRAVALGLLLFPVCAFSQITVSPASGSGVTNTGNAAVGDVASGKTFSSSVLTNATGTSTKNATVPNDAPIQPPQAFVDNMRADVLVTAFLQQPVSLNWSSKSITYLKAGGSGDGGIYDLQQLADQHNAAFNLDLSNNALTNCEALIESLASSANFGTQGGSINMSSGTNSAVSVGNDIVITNSGNVGSRGTYSQPAFGDIVNGKGYWVKSDNPAATITWWTASGTPRWRIRDEDLEAWDYTSTEDVASPWLVVTWVATAGATPVPTVSRQNGPNIYKTFLVSLGWTVTTN